jgi:hypothetical protein
MDFGKPPRQDLQVKHVSYFMKKYKLSQFKHRTEEDEGVDHDEYLNSLRAAELQLWEAMCKP